MKSVDEVVHDFNEIVNMTADELDAFLKTEGSESTGWSKDDGSGESIGHESGRKIVDILKRNPDKDPSKYTDEDKEHMRRVVSYCKRHLAQEDKLKESKSPEELEKTKSTRSLKNWGHDPLKTLPGGQNKSSTNAKPASSKGGAKPASKKAEKPKSKGKPQAQAQTEKKEDKVEEGKKAEEEPKAKETASEKPRSKGKAVNAAASDQAGAKAGAEAEAGSPKKKSDDAEVGEKREAETAEAETGVEAKNDKANGEKGKNGNGNGSGAAIGKPPSKKAKTTKEPTEPTRKPPSRGVKKA
ncbi:hypothetical protein IAT40_006767 [Kwoniella sp. CBS 6097]